MPDAKYLYPYGNVPTELACLYACSGITAFGAVKKTVGEDAGKLTRTAAGKLDQPVRGEKRPLGGKGPGRQRQAPLSLVTGRPAPRLTLAEAEQLAAQPIDSLY